MDTNFKKILTDRSIHYKTIGDIIGVSDLTISRYANGERKPQWDIAIRIKHVLKISDYEFEKLFDKIEK